MSEIADLLEYALRKAERLGASFADARYQEYSYENIVVDNRVLKSYSSTKSTGIGVRVIANKTWGFSSTTELTKEAVKRAVEKAVKITSAVAGKSRPAALPERKALKRDEKSKWLKDPFQVDPEEKVKFVLEAHEGAWIGSEIVSSYTRLGLQKDYRRYMSTDGVDVSTTVVLVGVAQVSVARVNGNMERVPYSESRVAGYEYIESHDWSQFTGEISQLAVDAAKAKTPSPGTYPVVVDPEVIGLLLHEAFGHASEGDLVEKGDSVLVGMLGKNVASDLVTIIDDGLVEGGYYVPFDDEGTEKRPVTVVERGVLKSYLHSFETAERLGGEPTGNGRAQDFNNMPIVRQTNYYMKPGNMSFEELIEDIDYGFYIKGRGATGGQVDTGMGTFTFSVGPSYIIEKGELKELVRGVTISGLILETLKTIDGVGKDFQVRTSVFGGCGKSGQMVRVGDGGPHVRVRKMTVGGAR